MVEPTRVHWVAAKHVLRYLRGTIDYRLLYRQVDEMSLENFTDSNWSGSSTDRKSTWDCTFNVGSTTVPWFTWK